MWVSWAAENVLRLDLGSSSLIVGIGKAQRRLIPKISTLHSKD